MQLLRQLIQPWTLVRSRSRERRETLSNKRHFKLVLYFSLTSLAAFLAAFWGLSQYFEDHAIDDAIQSGEGNNIILAQLIGQDFLQHHRDLQRVSPSLSQSALNAHPALPDISRDIGNRVQGTSIEKVTIFDLDGRILFASNWKGIGQYAGRKGGFWSALQGKSVTQLNSGQTVEASMRDRFVRNASQIKKDTLKTYVPIRSYGLAGPIELVIECYEDVTPLINKARQEYRQSQIYLGLVLGLLYLILFAIVWQGDRSIKRQTKALTKSELRYKRQTERLKFTLENLKQSQKTLVQQEKMAALGQLVSGIAHEVNTPLGAIQASISNTHKALQAFLIEFPYFSRYLDLDQQMAFFELMDCALQYSVLLSSSEKRALKRTLTQSLQAKGVENARSFADMLLDIGLTSLDPVLPLMQSPHAEWVLRLAYNLTRLQANSQTIQVAVERATKVVFALKTYAHYDHRGIPQLSSVTDTLKTVLDLYHNQLKHGIDVIQDFQDIPLIWCFPDELIQVWTNLIYNAIQAMGSVGTLKLSTCLEGNDVQVSITDSGCGIPEELKTKIFEPFFTTKPMGEGSGLGLDIVKKIVDKHQGHLSVQSQPGETSFTVQLSVGALQPQSSAVEPHTSMAQASPILEVGSMGTS